MRILVNGACGRMGKTLCDLIESMPRHELAAKVDLQAAQEGFLADLNLAPEIDMIIDFSHHSAICGLLDFAQACKCPVVVATTGHDEAELARIREAAKEIPVFLSGNMSVGVAQLCRMARETARLFPEADIEIVEIHHKHKKDAPSGTAVTVAEIISKEMGGKEFVYGREGVCPRGKEIGIHAVRGGDIVGDHTVMFIGNSERIEVRHQAHSREIFVGGAVLAAQWVCKQKKGVVYEMADVLA